jgi:hypothetical protein
MQFFFLQNGLAFLVPGKPLRLRGKVGNEKLYKNERTTASLRNPGNIFSKKVFLVSGMKMINSCPKLINSWFIKPASGVSVTITVFDDFRPKFFLENWHFFLLKNNVLIVFLPKSYIYKVANFLIHNFDPRSSEFN